MAHGIALKKIGLKKIKGMREARRRGGAEEERNNALDYDMIIGGFLSIYLFIYCSHFTQNLIVRCNLRFPPIIKKKGNVRFCTMPTRRVLFSGTLDQCTRLQNEKLAGITW